MPVPLPGPEPAAVVAALERAVRAGDDHPAVLWGRWLGGAQDQVLVFTRPTRSVHGLSAVLEALAHEPACVQVLGADSGSGRPAAVEQTVVGATPVVGGGWVVCLGYDEQTVWAQHYDQVLRWTAEGGWELELLPAATGSVEHRVAAARRLLQSAEAMDSTDEPYAVSAFRAGPGADPSDALLHHDDGRLQRHSTGHPQGSAPGDVGGLVVGNEAPAPPLRRAQGADAAREHYLAAVEQAIGQVDHGAFYQVNLCTRLHADFQGSGASLFAKLMHTLAPAYGAWLPAPRLRANTSAAVLPAVSPAVGSGANRPASMTRTVVSCSPELFLRIDGERITTAPIKGTVRREPGRDGAAELRSSAKDAAENVMITDLMRNDLSRVCRTGSVRVTKLLDIEAHPGVWHLVSTVEGQLPSDTDLAAVLRASFPPGSVTGAPKSSALRGIAAFEAEPRGAYTGAAGLISPYAGTSLSVLIRSFEIEHAVAPSTGPAAARVALGVGAGITVDSVPVREWQECLDKAAPLVAAAGSRLDPAYVRARVELPAWSGEGVFETILVTDGVAVRAAAHLARLDRSVRELYRLGLADDLAARVRAAAAPLTGRHALTVHAIPPTGPARADHGQSAVAAGGMRGDEPLLRIELATRPLGPRLTHTRLVRRRRDAVVWRHKWRDRRVLQEAEDTSTPDLPWFSDAAGLVAETSRGNLFALAADGHWVTPPLDEEVLPGVTRRETLDLLVDRGTAVRIARVHPAELKAGRPVFWTSSLSGAVAVSAVDGIALPVDEVLLAALNARLTAPGPGARR